MPVPCRLAFLLLPALLAACSNDPFVRRQTQENSVDKFQEVSPTGNLDICYTASTPWPQVELAASQACADLGLAAQLIRTEKYQCRMVAPHLAQFRCGDPAMTLPGGWIVFPFDKDDVAQWQAAQMQSAQNRQNRAPVRQAPPPLPMPGAAGAQTAPAAAASSAPTSVSPAIPPVTASPLPPTAVAAPPVKPQAPLAPLLVPLPDQPGGAAVVPAAPRPAPAPSLLAPRPLPGYEPPAASAPAPGAPADWGSAWQDAER